MADPFLIRLLGPVAVESAGQAIHGFESRRALALLCYLAARGQPVTRDRLVDLFWPAKSTAHGRGNLSRVLHNLSTLLPGALTADRHSVALNHSPAIWLDCAAFDDGLAHGTLAGLAHATALYRGPFMADIFLDDCPDFELWLVAERERWQIRVAKRLYDLATRQADGGADADALRSTRRLLAIEPWHEEAHRIAMRLLARDGQRSAALAQYHICRRALVAELGVEPDAQTVDLYLRIRAGAVEPTAPAPPPAAPPCGKLPLPLTSFVGRQAERHLIAARLDDPACRLLTLVGPGGVGKTRLAIDAAAARRHTFADGVWFVPLGILREPELIPFAVADVLHVTLTDLDDPAAQLAAALEAKQLLLVIDSFEHLRAGAELLVELLRAAPLIKILVTSRQRLNYQAEWLIPIGGMDYPADPLAEEVDRFGAVQLFAERAGRVQPAFALTRATAVSVARICRLVEGVPLAIELASAHAASLPCDAIARAIEADLDFLATDLHDLPDRHRSVRVLFEHSWQALSGDEQRVLAALTAFRGGFTPDAAEVVAGAASEVLARLERRFFIHRDAAERGELHDLVRQYAAEMIEPSQHDEIRRRHAACYLALAQTAAPELKGSHQEQWLNRLTLEHDNLRAALHWLSSSGDWEHGLRLAVDLWYFWWIRGHWLEGQVWLSELLRNSADHATPTDRCWALTAIGNFAWSRGDLVAARGAYSESLDLARGIGDAAMVAGRLHNIALVAFTEGDYATASVAAEEGMALSREIDHVAGVSNALEVLGGVAHGQGHYEAAQAHYSAKLDIERSLDNSRAIADTLFNLGNVAAERGDIAGARCLYEESLGRARQLRYEELVCVAAEHLGSLQALMGDRAEARALLESSLAAYRRLGDDTGVASAMAELGSLAQVEGDLGSARQLLGDALALCQRIDAPLLCAITLGYASRLARTEGDLAGARAMAGEALAISRSLGSLSLMAESFENLALVAAAAAEPQRATCLFGIADALRGSMGVPLQRIDLDAVETLRRQARAALGDAAFEAEWALGHAMSSDQALDLALGDPDAEPPA